MDATEPLVKEFSKTTEILPFTKYGLASFEEFKEAEEDIHHHEHLKKIGLTDDEIQIYKDHESGTLDNKTKMEKQILQEKLNIILEKISNHNETTPKTSSTDVQPGSSSDSTDNIKESLQTKKHIKFYPEGHPMNEIKELEDNLFNHLKHDEMLPINKRRKIMRRLEKKQERLMAQEKAPIPCNPNPVVEKHIKRNTLWDVKKQFHREEPHSSNSEQQQIIGPKRRTMYTVKDNKIVRLEPAGEADTGEQDYRAVDIVVPENEAEEQLLEGTKINVDDIRKIERFKNYEPGIPSKVLYLKNLSTTVTQEQLSILFNQFVSDNEGPVDLRLLTGRMRGQAFVAFNYEHVAIQAMDEINGTVLLGKPIIAEFGRNSNRIQIDDDR